tara:strand:+ start:507 stop:1682 length:1176 start_codon:yes stop_codon:yes gene_type:complete
MADFVILATADWDHPLWTNKQHTALSLIDHGHRVLYIESLGLRPPRASVADSRRILRRLQRVLRPPRKVKGNLWIWSPLVVPGGNRGFILALNRFLVRIGLSIIIRHLCFKSPLLWTYNPLSLLYLSLTDFQASIYHCVDSIQDQPGMPSALIRRSERDLCVVVDAVFTTSPELQQRLELLNKQTYFFGNVVDAKHFRRAFELDLPCPKDLSLIPKPRILFIGALDSYKINLVMMEELILKTPNWSYVLVGPIAECDASTDLSSVTALSNVFWFDTRPYKELPDWLAHSDVALLPLHQNDYTRFMFPMKFFEYLASGCSTVATSIPSLQAHSDVAQLCEPSAIQFEIAIRKALQGEGPDTEKMLERASQSTYEQRTKSMLKVLNRLGLLPL